MQAGEELLAKGRPREAAELFRKAVSLGPETKTAVKAIYKLGFTHETYLQDFDTALFNYQEFIRLSRDRISLYEVQKRLANLVFDQGRDYEKAIASYRKLLTLSPESLEADFFQLRIAQAYFRVNNFEQARLEYQGLVDRYPKSQYIARARYEIGNAYFMEGKYEIAQEALKQVLRLAAQSEYAVEAVFLLGQCQEHREQLAEALQTYESIRGRYPASDVLEQHMSGVRKRLSKVK